MKQWNDMHGYLERGASRFKNSVQDSGIFKFLPKIPRFPKRFQDSVKDSTIAMLLSNDKDSAYLVHQHTNLASQAHHDINIYLASMQDSKNGGY